MRCWIIAALSLCVVYQCVNAGNGYYYNPPIKRTDSQPPVGAQNDFDLSEFITSQKESILDSLNPQQTPAFRACGTCTCGIQNHRIVGGTQVNSNKYPWMAQLTMGARKRLFCGGAVISDRYILTAAHCIHNMNWRSIVVRIFQYDRSSTSLPGIERKVKNAIVHEGYNPSTIVNDIALLQLESPIQFTDQIRPICLPSKNQITDHKEGIVAGWGLTKENGQVSNILREVKVPIITNSECQKTKYKNMITQNMMCAGNVAKGGKDACQGDSGGPMAAMENTFKIIGVVSFGYGCAQPNAPGVYTRVSKYLDWIAKKTTDGCYCK